MASLEFFGEVPALVMRDTEEPRPFLLWIHGRTADKELDPGRYLRYVRAGINVCAVDLPGHGQRYVENMQTPESAVDVVLQMSQEVNTVLHALHSFPSFNHEKAAIGGMSAGGIAAILRLTEPHPFVAAVLEATMGQWRLSRHPADNLENWIEIPLLAFHSRHDQWIPYAAQEAFISRLKQQYEKPEYIEFVTFENTGAPKEHLGFGRESALVKEMQVDYLTRVFQTELEKTT